MMHMKKPPRGRQGQNAKIGNRPTNGYKSVREAERARELHLLEKYGKIRNLKEQVKYELIPAIWETENGSRIAVWASGNPARRSCFDEPMSDAQRKKRGMRCVQRSCSYFADFVYEDENGEAVVEDVKGWAMEDYKLKKKLMLWIYGIQIREV